MGDPQRLFRISDGSKATSYWWKKNAVPYWVKSPSVRILQEMDKKGITHSLNTIER